MRVVEFKSTWENYQKERRGLKPNTLRKIDEVDPRFIALRSSSPPKYIMITAVLGDVPDVYFVRRIVDYTEFEGWAIISWNDEGDEG